MEILGLLLDFWKFGKRRKTIDYKVIPMFLLCCFEHRDICVSIVS